MQETSTLLDLSFTERTVCCSGPTFRHLLRSLKIKIETNRRMATLDVTRSNVIVNGNLVATGGTLNISGNVYCTGDVSGFGQLSDRRLKSDITPLENCLDIIKSLDPVRFKWNDSEFNTYRKGKQDVGLIAQDTISDVKGEMYGYQTVNYEKLVPFLIGAIKELSQACDSVQEIRAVAE